MKSRSFLFIGSTIFLLGVERSLFSFPLTWVLLFWGMHTQRIPTVVLICLAILTDLLLLLPIGSTLVCLGVMSWIAMMSFGSLRARLVLIATCGMVAATVYESLHGTYHVSSILGTGCMYALASAIGTRATTVEEIGNVHS